MGLVPLWATTHAICNTVWPCLSPFCPCTRTMCTTVDPSHFTSISKRCQAQNMGKLPLMRRKTCKKVKREITIPVWHVEWIHVHVPRQITLNPTNESTNYSLRICPHEPDRRHFWEKARTRREPIITSVSLRDQHTSTLSWHNVHSSVTSPSIRRFVARATTIGAYRTRFSVVWSPVSFSSSEASLLCTGI